MGVENSYLKLSVKYQYGDDVKHRRIQAGKIRNSIGVANIYILSGVNSWWQKDFLFVLLFLILVYVILVLNAFWNHGNTPSKKLDNYEKRYIASLEGYVSFFNPWHNAST